MKIGTSLIKNGAWYLGSPFPVKKRNQGILPLAERNQCIQLLCHFMSGKTSPLFSPSTVDCAPPCGRRISLPMQARRLSIRRYRQMRGLTQTELAEATGLSLGYISQLERGSEKGGMKALHRLARFFDLPIEAVASFDDETEDVLDTWQSQTG